MAGEILEIESRTNGFKQKVDRKTYDALVKGGGKFNILSTKPAEKTAKTPDEVKEAKK